MNQDDTTENTMPYYKILNERECHHGLQYHEGMNEDILPFYPHDSCELGGMYYSRKDILGFIVYGPWLREVVLCEDSKVYKDPDEDTEKWKTNKFFLKPRKFIDIKVIQKLIDEGACIDANKGQALRWACHNNHLEIVKVLLKNGADIHALNESALRSASFNGHLEIVKLLIKYGADIHALNDAAFRRATANDHFKVVKILIKYDADIHALNDAVLISASSNGYLEIVKLLIKYGADIHALNDEAFRIATTNGHLEVIKVLLKAGININTNTIDYAVLELEKCNRHLKVVKFLRRYIKRQSNNQN